MKIMIFADNLTGEMWYAVVPEDAFPFFVRPVYHTREESAEDDEDELTH